MSAYLAAGYSYAENEFILRGQTNMFLQKCIFLVCKLSENSKKCQTQLLRFQGDITE